MKHELYSRNIILVRVLSKMIPKDLANLAISQNKALIIRKIKKSMKIYFTDKMKRSIRKFFDFRMDLLNLGTYIIAP